MKRVLVLNLVPNTVGDSIIMTPMFSVIKKNFPKSFVVATADGLTKELWQGHKFIDEIIEVKELSIIGGNFNKLKKAFSYLHMLLRLPFIIRKYKFDTCFITYPNYPLMPLIPFVAGIKNRIGFTYKGSFMDFLLTKKTPSKILFDGNYENHIVDSFMDLIKVSGLKYSKKDIVSRVYVSMPEIKKMNAALKKLTGKKKIICIHTMSKLVSKNWPKEKYSALLPLLQKQFGAAILLLGSKKEFEYNEDIRDENKDILNLCGVYPIRDVGAILSQCDLFIGNDSGIGHYASSLGTKTISIFGSTSPQQARPIGYGKTIVLFKNRTEDIFNTQKRGDVESDIKAMDSISVEDVMSAAKKMLS